jgi:hypothetical protein
MICGLERVASKSLKNRLVGARGFEPPTPCAQGRCATRLRYAPTSTNLRDSSPAGNPKAGALFGQAFRQAVQAVNAANIEVGSFWRPTAALTTLSW